MNAPLNTTMVIPSYWGRASGQPHREGDVIYDHPTPLDGEGTLGRCLKSLKQLTWPNRRLVVLVCPTAPDIADQADARVAEIVRRAGVASWTVCLGQSALNTIRQHLETQGFSDATSLLSCDGYSNVRNLCLFAPHLLGAEAALLIDDDEIIEDPEFVVRAAGQLGRTMGGETVLGVAGYYAFADGSYIRPEANDAWRLFWHKAASQNRAFHAIIDGEPALRPTPFCFGGNMTIHRSLFTKVAFDPAVPRGEDMDFLISCRQAGHNFFLDNRLAVTHLPPKNPHPTWRKTREDMTRFVLQRRKMRSAASLPGLTEVTADQLLPYPGEFLADDLDRRIFHTCHAQAMRYLVQGKPEEAAECLHTIEICNALEQEGDDPLARHLLFQKRWQKLMAWVDRRQNRRDLQAQLQIQ